MEAIGLKELRERMRRSQWEPICAPGKAHGPERTKPWSYQWLGTEMQEQKNAQTPPAVSHCGLPQSQSLEVWVEKCGKWIWSVRISGK